MTALTDNLRFLATKHDGDSLISRVPSSALIEAADQIERLRAALEPFARKVDGESLFIALAHITREDLLRAREAMDGKP